MVNYGRYQIVNELGKGSMGVVYLAHDPQIDRKVALKVLRQDRLGDEAFVQRFLQEAKAIGRLSHSGIVTVYDVGQDQGTIYIAMEFLEGTPLHRVMEGKALSPKEIIRLGIQVAESLDYAQQKGIVHRDIKPSNILVDANGQTKITDFGIAHIEDPAASVQTQAGEILGTPAYMSPEQVLSKPVDGRSDLYSLGIILYELSTGRKPFGGENLAAVFRSITQDTPPPVAKINPAIPLKFSQIIMKCLNKKPEDRFEKGRDLAKALKSCIEEVGPISERKSGKRLKQIGLAFFFIVLLGIAGYIGLTKIILQPKPPPSVERVITTFLKVESMPEGAQVFVDGEFKGVAPLRAALPIGKREVRLTLPDYHEWEAQVELKEGEEIPLRIRLIPTAEKKP